MKYIKYYEKINEELLAPSTIGNMFKKTFGTYQSPIWIHIKIFDNGIEKNCFIENDWVGINSVNILLMKELSERLNLNFIYKFSTNRFKYEMLNPICDFFSNLGLEIETFDKGEGSSEILIKGKLSEKDIRNKLH